MQIDVKEELPDKNLVRCNLYTGDRCITIYMSAGEYGLLIHDGFFIRDGKHMDSANVLNTTKEYLPA